MLTGSLFNIDSKEVGIGSVLANISIDPSHRIFDGHFPGQPVVPGVCMLQMIKESLEKTIHKKLQLKKASHLKFLAIINPLENPLITAEFSYSENEGEVVINGRLFKEALTFFKFKGVFVSYQY